MDINLDGNTLVNGYFAGTVLHPSPTYEIKAADFTAVGGGCYAVDSSAGPITVLMPGDPTEGQSIELIDLAKTWGQNNVTISGNGNNLRALDTAVVGQVDGTRLLFVFAGTRDSVDIGWQVYPILPQLENLVAPSIVGVAKQHVPLTASPGVWSGFPTGYTYQWQSRSAGLFFLECSIFAVPDEGSTYPIASSAWGFSFTVGAVGSGADLEFAVDSAGATVAATIANYITSNWATATAVGVRVYFDYEFDASPLDCIAVSNNDTAWHDIAGATSSSYTIDPKLLGCTIRFSVIASNITDTSQPVLSAPTVAIGALNITNGCLAFWSLDETSGTRIDDSGNGYDLTDNNSVGYEAGVIGNAALFAAGGEYLSEGGGLDMEGVTEMSWVCWIKTTSSFSTQENIFGRWWAGSTAEFLFYAGGTNACYAIVCTPAGYYAQVTPPAEVVHNDGEWHHLGASISGGVLSFYGDGVLLGTATVVGALSPCSYPLWIGACPYAGYSNPFNGGTDMAGVWNRALSVAEFEALYNLGYGFNPFA